MKTKGKSSALFILCTLAIILFAFVGYKGAEVQQDITGADVLWKSYALFEEKWKKIH